MTVRPRLVMTLHQSVARVWLTSALLASLAAAAWPGSGRWLPLHLALAGAVTTAISGAVQMFVLAMTATAGPSERVTWLRLVLLTVGVAALAVGVPRHLPWMSAAGGMAFIAAMAMLAWLIAAAWRRSLQRRHAAVIGGYTVAAGAAVLGSSLAAAVATGAADARWIAPFGRAHVVLNVLGFASITVLSTFVTFVPTVLGVRMPRRSALPVIVPSVVGVALMAGGALGSGRWAFAVGAVVFAVGAVTAVSLVFAVLRLPRVSRLPGVAMHLGAGLMWFVGGCLALAWAARRGPVALDAARPAFLIVFVAGWLVQVLLGAWSYLLPMARAGHPDERRRQLAVGEAGVRVQVVCVNVGLAILLGVEFGWLGGWASRTGTGLALAGAFVMLAKAWCFPWLARGRLGGPQHTPAVRGERP